MTILRDPKTGQLLPGTGRLGPGRTPGARNKLQLDFCRALAKDFEEHGEGIIRIARIEDPVAYLKLIASILPKELVVEARAIEGMSDEEIKTALDTIGKIARLEPPSSEPESMH
jgi:hypothetical protein